MRTFSASNAVMAIVLAITLFILSILGMCLLVKSCYASPPQQSIEQLCMYILRNGTVVDSKTIFIKIIEPSPDGLGENRYYATMTLGFNEKGEAFVMRLDFIQEWWGKDGSKDVVVQLIVSDLFADGLADRCMAGTMVFESGNLLEDTRVQLSERDCEQQHDRLFYKFLLRCSTVSI